MGFNTTILAVEKSEGVGRSDVVEALLQGRKSRGAAAEDEVFSNWLNGTALIESDRWVTLIDPSLGDIFERDDLAALSERCTVVALMIHETSSTYGWSIHEAGGVRRRFLRQEDEELIDDGEPDADEEQAMQEEFDDDRVLAYARRLGIPTPVDEPSAEIYEPE